MKFSGLQSIIISKRTVYIQNTYTKCELIRQELQVFFKMTDSQRLRGVSAALEESQLPANSERCTGVAGKRILPN